MFIKLIFLSVFAIVLAEKVRYDEYTLYKVNPQNEDGLLYLKDLYTAPGKLTFWSTPNRVGDDVSVLASPDVKKKFEASLAEKKIKMEVITEDMQKEIDVETKLLRKRSNSRQIFFDQYNTLEDIYSYFDTMANIHDFVSTFVAGTTFQGRNITGLKINRGDSSRVFILVGGEIGADWLSPTLVTYIADQLINNATDSEIMNASRDFEWHIIPSVNPDGFMYSQNQDRLWIKNRRIDSRNPTGVDLTRNWNADWGFSGGSFDNTASNYIGLGPFSEPETRSVSNYFTMLHPRITSVLSFRTFGQRLFIPLTLFQSPLYNHGQMLIVSRRALGSLAVKYNTQYIAGSGREFGDSSTGNMGDWAKIRFNPPVVGTYRLRGSSHVLPIAQVQPSCEETFDSVLAIIREARFINVI